MLATGGPMADRSSTEPHAPLTRGILARAALGGVLMGLANLVPGISGGTMLVATGVYSRFIDAVSDATRLRLSRDTILLLGAIVGAAIVAIGGLAGVISLALAEFRWEMYSLFIGLTLGGVPILWRMARPLSPAALAGIVGGIAVMIGLVVFQSADAGGSASAAGWASLTIAGMAGASAMILPGVSGAYLLLILGQYENIISVVKDTVKAAAAMDIQGVLAGAGTLIPVGVGVLLGVAIVGNALRFVLHRYEKATLGFLLGLLLAAPAGLYPFLEGVRPEVGDLFEGVVVTEESRQEIDPKDWPVHSFAPGATHLAGAAGLVLLGIGMTLAVGRLGRDAEQGREHGTDPA